MSKIHSFVTLCSCWLQTVPVVVLLVLVLATPAVAGTATLTLAWDASSDPSVDGYIIEWGESSGTYTDEVDVGDLTSYTITGLVDGRRYYITVRSYTSGGVESAPSNEVSGVATAPPPPPPPPEPEPEPEPEPTPGSDPDPTPDPEPATPDGLGILDFDADSMDDLVCCL